MYDDIVSAILRVIRSRDRLGVLLSDRGQITWNISRFLHSIVPLARKELDAIALQANKIPDMALRTQALSSINFKAFHAAGACIHATFLPRHHAEHFVRIVVPLESIYDYLDNLCDRHPIVSPEAYPVLHGAIADALDPRAPLRDYYRAGPTGDDGGYLAGLVQCVQRELAPLHTHAHLALHFARAAQLYARMQSAVHLPTAQRVGACVDWYDSERIAFHELDWHEFACAAGSQFQVYAPLYAAFSTPDEIDATFDAYFPWVSALHVLLDSFIDQDEDRASGDLNFAQIYGKPADLRGRASWLAANARSRFDQLHKPQEHRFVLTTMALFYLSHPKLAKRESEALKLLKAIVG